MRRPEPEHSQSGSVASDRSRFRFESQAFPRTRLASTNQQGGEGGIAPARLKAGLSGAFVNNQSTRTTAADNVSFGAGF